jgi:hypothetical protein
MSSLSKGYDNLLYRKNKKMLIILNMKNKVGKLCPLNRKKKLEKHNNTE